MMGSSLQQRAVIGVLVTSMALAGCGGATGETSDAAAGADPADPASTQDQGGSQDQAEVTVRYASVLAPTDPISEITDWMMEEITDRSGGAVTFQHQYSGALLPGAEILNGVGGGRAQGGYVVPAYTPAELPLLNLAMVPVPYDAEARLLAQQRLVLENEIVAAELAELNVTPIAYTMVPAPWGLATTNPVSSPDQLDGLRLRVLPGVTAPYEAFGAEPVFLSVEEQYESLQRGVLDGVVAPINSWVSAGLHEVAPHMAIHGIGAFGAGVITMNKDLFDGLTDSTKAMVREVAAESLSRSVDAFADAEQEACEAATAEGATVTQWAQSDIDEFRAEMGTTLVDNWKAAAVEAGHSQEDVDAVWDAYAGYLEEFAASSDYESGLEACISGA